MTLPAMSFQDRPDIGFKPRRISERTRGGTQRSQQRDRKNCPDSAHDTAPFSRLEGRNAQAEFAGGSASLLDRREIAYPGRHLTIRQKSQRILSRLSLTPPTANGVHPSAYASWPFFSAACGIGAVVLTIIWLFPTNEWRAIVGGLIFSQLLTLYTTPVVYLYLDRFRLWCKGKWSKKAVREELPAISEVV
mgnify:CR=1 FL=1